MGINLKQCEKAYLQSIYYLKSLLINSQDIRDVPINIPYSVQITRSEINKVKQCKYFINLFVIFNYFIFIKIIIYINLLLLLFYSNS